MKRLLAACAALGALALAGQALAFNQEAFSPTIHEVRPWEAGHDFQHQGMGERVGTAALPGKDRLLVVGKRATTQLFVTRRTRFYRDGREVASDTLTQGDTVRAFYDIWGNTNVARRVEIVRPAAP